MITTLLVCALAVTWAWEALRTLVDRTPFELPSWLLPFIVFGFALAVSYPDWRMAAGAAGLAGVLNAVVRSVTQGSGDVVPLRALRQAPSRIPPLP